MNRLIEWFARHSRAANLLVLATMIGGLIAASELPKEILPRIEPNILAISSALPGASAEQIEQTVCSPLETIIKAVPDIKHINAVSTANMCTISVELDHLANLAKSTADLNTAVNLVSLPNNASKPIVYNAQKEVMAIRLAVSGTADYRTLLRTAKSIADELQALGLNKVKVIEAKNEQLSIEPNAEKMAQFQISLAEIAASLHQNTGTLPAGNMQGAQGTTSVVINSNINPNALGNTVIRSLPDGTQLRLADIANIKTELSNLDARVNGEPAVAISIYQGNSRDIFSISTLVQRYIAKQRAQLPDNMHLQIVFDNAEFFNARMSYLKTNFISGLFVSGLLLFLWLRARMAFWITADIPIAFGGALIWLYLMGGSINMVSAFGFIIVLGIVCDDAIVIGENIYRHQSSGKTGLEGAIHGVKEVAGTVIFAVGTTIIMFIPLLFLPGSEGQLMQPLPMVVIAVLVASLIEALLVLPTHLSHQSPGAKVENIGYAVAERMDAWVLAYYKPLLAFVIRWRYAFLVSCIALLIISLSTVLSGNVRIHFLSDIQTEIATGSVTFPNGNNHDRTHQAILQMEQAAISLNQELRQQYGTDQITLIRTFIANDANHGEIYLNLASASNRKLDNTALMQKWQEKTGNIDGALETQFNAAVNLDKTTFHLLLTGNNARQLEAATLATIEKIKQYKGVSDVKNILGNTRPQISLTLKNNAADLGLNLQTISAQVHLALEGTPSENINNTSIVLRMPENSYNTIAQLESMPIQVSPAISVPLGSIANIQLNSEADTIQHIDGNRIAHITAKVDAGMATPSTLMKQLETDYLNQLDTHFSGIGWTKTGALEAEQEIKHYLLVSFILSLMAMFIFLAVFLNSYSQPLLIFTAIPYGIIGALLGHLLFAHHLTLWSIAGIIAVSGIVVNNNMVIIFFINERIKAGHSLIDTVLLAGADRFRPIMLTTVTTFAGVLPTILGNSWETQFLIPLAISIGCGVMFAAALTLLLVPCLYMIGDDIKRQKQTA